MKTLDNYHAYPITGSQRFSGESFDWLVTPLTTHSDFLTAMVRFELACSYFHPSSITFRTANHLFMENVNMATRGGQKTAGKVEGFKGFINIDLGVEDRATLQEAHKKFHAGKALEFLLTWGKVSMSHDNKKGRFNASVVFAHGDIAGWCVSSFGKEPMLALHSLAHKIQTYGETLVPGEQGGSDEDFG